MAVKLRLARGGSTKRPFYRIVAADIRSPRDGRFIEAIGHYDPKTNPATFDLDLARLDHWLKNGALPTRTVASLARKAREAEAKAAS
jgi:small subunit ribosomal protein S16